MVARSCIRSLAFASAVTTVTAARGSIVTTVSTGGGVPAYAHRRPAVQRVAALCDVQVSVADLGLTVGDLTEPLPAGADVTVVTRGVESSSGLPVKVDEGVSWQESFDAVTVTLEIPGLRGQPAAAMAVELTESTATITVFGRTIWSCVLRGEIDLLGSEGKVARVEGMQPIIEIVARKVSPEPRWNGFIASIGVDSVLQ
jgi:hypothetical protein